MVSLAAQERQDRLLAELRATQSVALADAAMQLGVSEMTVRRDLDRLEERGLARRVRGGAVYAGPVSFGGRSRSHSEEKREIARKLLPLVPEEGVIALDSSTTMHHLAGAIEGDGDLTVVTNGLLTFEALRDRPGIVAILTGGRQDARSDSLIGPVATATLDAMRFTAFFASAAAIDPQFCFEDTFEEAEVKKAFARAAGQVVLGAHSDKLGAVATAAAVPLERVGVLATELPSAAPELEEYRGRVPRVL